MTAKVDGLLEAVDICGTPGSRISSRLDRLSLGVSYHPEHYRLERLGVDLDLIVQAGINVARVADSA